MRLSKSFRFNYELISRQDQSAGRNKKRKGGREAEGARQRRKTKNNNWKLLPKPRPSCRRTKGVSAQYDGNNVAPGSDRRLSLPEFAGVKTFARGNLAQQEANKKRFVMKLRATRFRRCLLSEVSHVLRIDAQKRAPPLSHLAGRVAKSQLFLPDKCGG